MAAGRWVLPLCHYSIQHFLKRRYCLPGKGLINIWSKVNTKYGFGRTIPCSLHPMADLMRKNNIPKSKRKSSSLSKNGWICPGAIHWHQCSPSHFEASLPHRQESAKMSMITAVQSSKDPLVKECLALLVDRGFVSHDQFRRLCYSLLQPGSLSPRLPTHLNC